MIHRFIIQKFITKIWWRRVTRSRMATIVLLQHLVALEKEGANTKTELTKTIIQNASAHFAKLLVQNCQEEIEHSALFEKCLRALGAAPARIDLRLYTLLEEIPNQTHLSEYHHYLLIGYIAERMVHESLRDLYVVASEGCVKNALRIILLQEEGGHIETLRDMLRTSVGTYSIELLIKKYKREVEKVFTMVFCTINIELSTQAQTPFFIINGLLSQWYIKLRK